MAWHTRRKRGWRRTPDVDVGSGFAAAHIVMDRKEVVVREGVQSPEFVRACFSNVGVNL